MPSYLIRENRVTISLSIYNTTYIVGQRAKYSNSYANRLECTRKCELSH